MLDLAHRFDVPDYTRAFASPKCLAITAITISRVLSGAAPLATVHLSMAITQGAQ
jgi:hypothetical protein